MGPSIVYTATSAADRREFLAFCFPLSRVRLDELSASPSSLADFRGGLPMLGLGTSRESSREMLETYLESPSTPFVRFGNLSIFAMSSVGEAIVVDSEWFHERVYYSSFVKNKSGNGDLTL